MLHTDSAFLYFSILKTSIIGMYNFVNIGMYANNFIHIAIYIFLNIGVYNFSLMAELIDISMHTSMPDTKHTDSVINIGM